MKSHRLALAAAVLALVSTACSSAATPDRGAPVPAAGGTDTSTTTSASGDDDDDDGTGADAGSGGGSNGGSGNGTGGSGATADGGPALDWQEVYSLYFGPGTDGHCAQCHGVTGGLAGFSTGATADSMYQGLIAATLLDATDPAASPLGLPGK